jgi:hypothetical protein
MKRLGKMGRPLGRAVIAALTGAFAFGLMDDIHTYRALVSDTKGFAEAVKRLEAEEKETVEKRARAIQEMEKQLEPEIGTNPFHDFARIAAMSINPLFDPRVTKAWENFQQWEKKFEQLARKRFPIEWNKVQTMDQQLKPAFNAWKAQRSAMAVGKATAEIHQQNARNKPKALGLGAAAGVSGLVLGLSVRRGLKGPIQRYRNRARRR